jgi:hypothetical protein
MLDAHLIVIDELSEQILMNELISLYQCETLPRLSLSYEDYVTWQQTEEQRNRIPVSREFWLRELQDEPNKLILPYDFDRPAVAGHHGALPLGYFNDESLTREKFVDNPFAPG